MGYTQKLGLLAQSVFQDSSLNVGIGGSPSGSYKFEVTGTAKVSGAATFSSTISAGAISTFYSGGAGTAGQIRLGYDATAYWQIGRLDPAGTGSGNFQFKPNAGASVLDITTSGNVGIGGTNPGNKLQVFGATLDSEQIRVSNSNGAGYWGIGRENNTTGDLYFNNTSNLKIIFKASGGMSIIGPSATNPSNLYLSCITSTGNNDTLRVSTSVENSGKVSIETLQGSGNRAVYSDSTGLLTNSSSDATLKKNVENIIYGLNSVLALRPISFNWIPENLGEQKEIGFIAQEVQEIVPEVIGVNSDETLSLDYPKLTAVLVKAIQEQNQLIEYLKSRLDKAGL